MDGVQGVEPSAGLVHAFGYEIGGVAEIGSAQAAQTCLSVRHGAGVEPHIDQIALPCHLPAARADEENPVHVRTVEVYAVVVLLGHIFRVKALGLQRIALHEAGLDSLFYFVVQFLYGAYAYFFLAVLGAPDRERCAPVAAAAEVPVLDVLEPFAETTGAGCLRLPGNLFVELHHLLPYS